MIDLIIINKKNWTYKIVDFAVPADHRIKLKGNEKKDKYRNPARELKKLWNMKVMVIPIVTGALGSVIKELVKGQVDLEIRWQVETMHAENLYKISYQRTSLSFKKVFNSKNIPVDPQPLYSSDLNPCDCLPKIKSHFHCYHLGTNWKQYQLKTSSFLSGSRNNFFISVWLSILKEKNLHN